MEIVSMDEERRKRLRDFVNRLAVGDIPLPQFADDNLAPEIEESDRELLVLLARGELPEDLSRHLYRRIFTFKSWCDAHTETVVAEYHRNGQVSEE